MTRRMTLLAVLVALGWPATARASDGILILAANGTAEWNAGVKDFGARIEPRAPVEVVFGMPARATIGPAVDRLVSRGVTNVLAVPLFLSTPVPADQLTGHGAAVKLAPVPTREQVLTDIIVSRASEINPNPAGPAWDVLVLLGYGADDHGASWMLDLAPAAQRINQQRRFAAILTIGRPDSSTEREQRQMRAVFDRHVEVGRRIVVVPLVTAPSASTFPMNQWFGPSYEISKGGVVFDDRLIDWILTQTQAPR
jgi:sirohydrochlorin ferrochelatase